MKADSSWLHFAPLSVTRRNDKEFSLRVRRANTEDVLRIMDLERESASAAHWSKQQYEDMLGTSDPQSAERVVLIAAQEATERSAEILGSGTSGAKASTENELLIAALKRYATQNRSFSANCEDESEILGFLVARRVGVEWELENIVVANDMRRGGTGRLLLTELITLARAAGGCAISLEVRESNQDARAFYRRMGFEEVGVRNRYYTLPAENAILYRLKLS